MTLPKKEDYIFYQGEKFQVEFYFTKTGKIPAKEYLEKESLDIQVKPVNHRFFSFFYKGKKIIITNAYIKKSQKVSKGDLEKARNMKKTYVDRIKGGTYYEKN